MPTFRDVPDPRLQKKTVCKTPLSASSENDDAGLIDQKAPEKAYIPKRYKRKSIVGELNSSPIESGTWTTQLLDGPIGTTHRTQISINELY